MDILFIICAAATGAVIAWLAARSFFSKGKTDTALYLQLDKEKSLLEQQVITLRDQNQELKQHGQQHLEEMMQLNGDLVRWKNESKHLEEKLQSQKSEIEALHLKMKEQFENIASKIVFDNSQRIQQQHKDKLDDMLNPLKEKIEKFESRVKETHEERIREHQSLKEQLLQLQQLNKTIGDEARNLTTALKGQVKTQGNWGELILEKILQRSGLTRGKEYEIQASLSDESGKRLQPDVIIHLPENKHIVIDSKVSVISYERYCSCENDTERIIYLKEHIASLRKHVKDLGAKNYQQLYQLNTLDFVLLFVPVEPAFALAIEHDQELFNDAFDRNIVIVTTSTLLATLRTIASIWKIEKQSQNARQIARQSGELYDKFVGLVQDLLNMGNRLNAAKDSYDESMKKLHTGRGNLISKAEKIRALGAESGKSLPQPLLDRTEDLGDLLNVDND